MADELREARRRIHELEAEAHLARIAQAKHVHEWQTKQVELVQWCAQVHRENEHLRKQLAQAEAHHQEHHAREGALQAAVQDQFDLLQAQANEARALLKMAAEGFADAWEVSTFTEKACALLAQHKE